jgi:uncharacterized protein YfaS (alpha-2-macroglobulin family)
VPPRRLFHRALAIGFLLVATGAAHALRITSVSPQGEVAKVRQVVANFDGPAVRFGDASAPAPLDLACDAGASKVEATGRWLSDRRWVFDLGEDLAPGVRCTVSLRPGFRSAAGETPAGPSGFSFNTGGPAVVSLQPYDHERIDEQQVFVLRLTGPATAGSLLANVWCAVEGLGEKVPVRAVDGAQRAAVLKAVQLDKAAAVAPLVYPTLACNRTLPAAAHVALVYGRGVATPSGVANRQEKRFRFQVRERFEATFSCERENAQAGCMPIRPMNLVFNAPVSRKLAASIRLTPESGASVSPTFDDPEGLADSTVDSLKFPGPFPERTRFMLELPAGLQDSDGRKLSNATVFPLKVATGPMPPLAKFSAAPFGIIERFAEPDSEKTGKAMLPVTLRNVEGALDSAGAAPGKGTVSDLRLSSDADIITWQARVQRYDETTVSREQAAMDVQGPLPRKVKDIDGVESRSVSLLAGKPGVSALVLPQAVGQPDPRPFEVVGIPLDPGFHVVEIASQRLGQSMLDERYGANRPMFVRTTALVTNLGVHFKLGRENALAWVTTLDKGQPVADATVRVSDCQGREVAHATTDKSGIARFEGISPQPPACGGDRESVHQAYFVSARARVGGVEDLSFVWSDSDRGIESWRFNAPTSRAALPDLRAHTVFDRTLLRAGETVSMKHLLRSQSKDGFGVPTALPATVVITHDGSGQEYSMPLVWRKTATGGRSAENSFALPAAAKLGSYSVSLKYGESRKSDGEYVENDPERGLVLPTGAFRVEEFRLPVFQGRIGPVGDQPLVHVTAVPTQLQISYVAGGGAANLPVRVSALVRAKRLEFPDFDGFRFDPPKTPASETASGDDQNGDETAQAADDARVITDKAPVVLDRNGAGKLTIANVPPASQPRDLLLEALYADPNGEVQTLRSTSTLWPAAVIAGIRTEGWVSANKAMRFQALALGLDGKPRQGVALSVKATARIVTTSRKRMVGGFYTYDNKTDTRDLGEVCSGKSDAKGLLACETKIEQAGEVELVVTARDPAGNGIQAAGSVYVTRQGELWFGGEDHDRIDLLPEKKTYQPGETARLQVRMPFRFATALVSVEREGIVETQVVQLNGQDPTLSLKVKEGWGPNVYISVLVLRGRLREVPWYSFFTWGYRAPREWLNAFRFEGRDWVAPSALVDLSKPAYRFGMAEIKVGTQAHRIEVSVAADKPSYPVRGKAVVTITGRLPDGKPAAGAEVALAAVDQALLELMPNDSWNVLDAMLQRRAWGVQTSTAQMDIVGRRHYGRKAVPAGGGGGHSASRELLETLLLWNPRVVLDAQGRATVEVPLNDALTTFRIVAVADAGTGLFGTGQTTIRATQDLQIISGLPPLVREGDRFRAQVTLRNTTGRAMKVEVNAKAPPLVTGTQTVEIPPNEAREVFWEVTAPDSSGVMPAAESLAWEISARETSGTAPARDALKVRQRMVPAVPVTVQQANLQQLDGPLRLEVAPPAAALPVQGMKRGGIKLSLQPRLAEGLPAVRDWFVRYPFACLEQKTSKAVGLADGALWKSVAAALPTYLDSDGLASYFPPREEQGSRGSDTLTAYVLAATHEASVMHPAFALPEESRDAMLKGLAAFVEGRIQRDFWSPRKDLDVRKIAALEALSRYGRAQGRQLGSIAVTPNQWPTHAVIDWLNILKRVADVPQRAERLAEVQQILRARLSYQGTRLIFSTERDDYWWWLMANGDANSAKLMLAVMDDPAWKDDLPKIATGFIGRQQNGAWATTTANLWGGLALERFSARFESTPVAGSTRASLGGVTAAVDWSKVEKTASGERRGNDMLLPWPATGAPGSAALEVAQLGTGKPWLTVQSLAAVPRTQPFTAGYAIRKTITPVEQARKGAWTRGDVLRVKLEVDASADMTWVALTDPIPGGSTILGGGLGRDSVIATQGEKKGGADGGAVSPAYEEKGFESWRGYYEYVPKGRFQVEYTVRLNNVGAFSMPATRVEALYAPEMFGETPNARMTVEAAP